MCVVVVVTVVVVVVAGGGGGGGCNFANSNSKTQNRRMARLDRKSIY